MTKREFIKQMRAIIEAGWTQGAYARNADGQGRGPSADDACQFCILGAWRRINCMATDSQACREASHAVINDLEDAVVARYCEPRLGVWNDAPERTQADVLAVIDSVAAKYDAAA